MVNADYTQKDTVDVEDFTKFKKYYLACEKDQQAEGCKTGDLTCDLITNLEDFNEFKDQLILFDKTKKLKFEKSKVTETPTVTPKQTDPPKPIEYIKDNFDGTLESWFIGPAMRHNRWPPPNFENDRLEEVGIVSYKENNYSIYVPLTWHGGVGTVDTWFVNIAEYAPFGKDIAPLPDNYCLELRAKFANSTKEYDPWWAYWGIIFGGNEEKTDFYSFKVNANHDFAVLEHKNYQYPGNREGQPAEGVNIETQLSKWGNHDLGDQLSSTKYNTLRVKAQGTTYQFYINGQEVVSLEIPNVQKERIGVIGGPWEYTPVEIWFDYLEYDANCQNF
jgi:hypothetical protein